MLAQCEKVDYGTEIFFFLRCSLFLVDHERGELVAKVFDGETTKDDEVKLFAR